MSTDTDAAVQPFLHLSPDQVVSCVEALGFPCDLRLIALNSYENRVYQVGIEDADPIIVKFYRPKRWSDAQIQEEHSFSQELAEHGLSVVAPMLIEGESLFHVDGFRLTAFARRGGYPPELDNLDHQLILGRTLGRIHRIGSTQPFSYRESLKTQALFEEARDFLLERFVPRDLHPAYDSLLTDCSVLVAERLAQYGTADEIRLHGDCHVGNILWRDDLPHFVDLDDCVSGPAIQDLWMFLNGDRAQQELQLAELIAGYEEFHDFDPQQISWIEALRTLRIVKHALWLGRRWHDPAFPRAFPWFGQERFWSDHILELREQLAALQEPSLRLL